jgi:hypothetical protein
LQALYPEAISIFSRTGVRLSEICNVALAKSRLQSDSPAWPMKREDPGPARISKPKCTIPPTTGTTSTSKFTKKRQSQGPMRENQVMLRLRNVQEWEQKCAHRRFASITFSQWLASALYQCPVFMRSVIDLVSFGSIGGIWDSAGISLCYKTLDTNSSLRRFQGERNL